jgi:hypothetical protein
MNLNKYLIAAMLGTGLIGAASAQNTKNHSFNNQQEYQVPEQEASNLADFQTKEMIAALGLNADQASKIHKINVSHAEEIERAKSDCGNDITGFNEYVERVASARELALSNVLTREQFALYCDKSNGTWLGMDRFKSEDFKVKGNKNELKVKGKPAQASDDISASGNLNANEGEFSDAYRNNNNIILTQPAKPDLHNFLKADGEPLRNESGETESEQDNSSGINNSDENTFSFGQTLNSENGVFINEDSKTKFTEKEAKIKPEEGVKYKYSDEETKVKDGSDKIKLNENEEKYKTGDSKIKVNDNQLKSKDKEEKLKKNNNELKNKFSDGAKVKENDNELKMKDGKGGKIKSNDHETKIKKDDLKIKIKEQ